jgi:hypothetical protein
MSEALTPVDTDGPLAIDWIGLTLLVGELETDGAKCPVNTRKLRDFAADRLIPATLISGRWHVRRSDLPKVRTALGMKPSK